MFSLLDILLKLFFSGISPKKGDSLSSHYTGCPKSELDIENTPLPNPLFFQKISDSAFNEP
jgi:hypothetical protein